MLLCYLALIPVVIFICILVKIYGKLTTRWCRSQTCLVGKTAIVTGANRGIGYATALDFAKRGARVILACRNQQQAENARLKIVNETGNENIVVKIIDLSSFESVRLFAKNINESEDRLDILINNAAVLESDAESISADGYALNIQVNYLSSFLLTNLLIGLMKKSRSSRIVNLSSVVAKFAYNFDVNQMSSRFSSFNGYSFSKLGNLLLTIELAKRLKGTTVTAYSVNPGIVNTGIFKVHIQSVEVIVNLIKSYLLKTSEEGAQSIIYCAVTKGIEEYSGEYFVNCEKVSRYKTVAVPGLPEKLWEITKDIVQLRLEEMQL